MEQSLRGWGTVGKSGNSSLFPFEMLATAVGDFRSSIGGEEGGGGNGWVFIRLVRDTVAHLVFTSV